MVASAQRLEKVIPVADDAPPSATATQWLASGLTVITGGAAVFGASTGALGRVIRDHPDYAKTWLGVALLAVAIGVIMPAVVDIVPDGVIVLGTLLLAASLWALGTRMADDQSRSARPQVAGALSTTSTEVKLTGSVKASGLRSTDHMLVQADKYTTGKDMLVNLYTAFVGPNADGKVDAAISLSAARGKFDRIVVSGEVQGKIDETKADQTRVELCDASLRYRGCAVLVVPRKSSSKR